MRRPPAFTVTMMARAGLEQCFSLLRYVMMMERSTNNDTSELLTQFHLRTSSDSSSARDDHLCIDLLNQLNEINEETIRCIMLLRIMALVTAVVHMVSSQDRGGTILEHGSSSDSQSVIVTPRTRAFLSCESGDIVVKVNFTLPFRGLMYAHRSRNTPCRIHGTGDTYYELRIPLKGCGTWQESPRVFVNNITIRFHSALELEEDETKTVVCRYPPPLTPSPGSIEIIEPHPKLPTVSPNRVSTARLSEVEILILICLLLFLSLLTLGIGIAYFCLKRRNLTLVRHRKATPSAPPSQLTRLSSSNRPPSHFSSNRSSVLGATVRIPRAVPYSAPPPGRTLSSALSNSASSPFEEEEVDFRTSSSTEETSASTSSSEDQSRNLLYRKAGPKSILSIPKAILRNAGGQRWRAQQQPAVHQLTTRSAATSVKSRLEREDQTVTTVLEPEIHFDEISYYAESSHQDRAHSRATTQNSLPDTASPIPVYAQIDKHKKVKQESELVKKVTGKPPLPPGNPSSKASPQAKRQKVVPVTPEVHRTSEEVTKNTTVTTSVKREVKDTKVSDPALLEKLKAKSKSLGVSTVVGRMEKSSALTTTAGIKKSPKNILIRDVSDVYLTTTVETELRELTTRVSKDVVEQHAKSTIQESIPRNSKVVPQLEKARSTVQETVPQDSTVISQPVKEVSFPDTRSWNVIIRQRSPDVPSTEDSVDASGADNEDSLEEETRPEPEFKVKIRAIPPEELKPKNVLMLIPPLEMPSSVGKLRDVLEPSVQEVSPEDSETSKQTPQEGASKQPRSVRWTEDTKEAKNSTVSSSDSFQSSESLRERSSSEVLEVAPTLPSQQRKKDQPSMLERSTSEIVTSPADHSRWVGGVVPVLETLSPEFLANIPTVVQGGFFNRQRSPTPAETAKNSKKV
ncbi:hypothetical protein JTE90_020698 [Oedothorax gibbosus]|uniref:ZP domain-containing protein n=1 Tax=Oedothorax gibbosus TaxID=931172 RepID=A0AAV6V707_9ARAC|nr:hypothetical protein JTE90_020698 [Oedothorax gibbosus]